MAKNKKIHQNSSKNKHEKLVSTKDKDKVASNNFFSEKMDIKASTSNTKLDETLSDNNTKKSKSYKSSEKLKSYSKTIKNNQSKNNLDLKEEKEDKIYSKSSICNIWIFIIMLISIPALLIFTYNQQPNLLKNLESQLHFSFVNANFMTYLDKINLRNLYDEYINFKFEAINVTSSLEDEKKYANSIEKRNIDSSLLNDISTFDESILPENNNYDTHSNISNEFYYNKIESNFESNVEKKMNSNLNEINDSVIYEEQDDFSDSFLSEELTKNKSNYNDNSDDLISRNNLVEVYKILDSKKLEEEYFNNNNYTKEYLHHQDILKKIDNESENITNEEIIFINKIDQVFDELIAKKIESIFNGIYFENANDSLIGEDGKYQKIIKEDNSTNIKEELLTGQLLDEKDKKEKSKHIEDVEQMIEYVELKDNNIEIENDDQINSDILDLELIDEYVDKDIEDINSFSIKNGREAVHFFHDKLLQTPDDIIYSFGKARSLTIVAENEDNPILLTESVEHYLRIMSFNPDKKLMLIAAKYCLLILSQTGQENLIENLVDNLMKTYPNNFQILTNLAIELINYNKVKESKKILELIISKSTSNINANLVLGYLYKVHLQDNFNCVNFMLPKIGKVNTNSLLIFDTLSDALYSLNEKKVATQIYKRAVELNLIPSVYQRPKKWLTHIESNPWWSDEDNFNIPKQVIDNLVKNLQEIKNEVEYLSQDDVQSHNLPDVKYLQLYNEESFFENCDLFPKTCVLLKENLIRCPSCSAAIKIVKWYSDLKPMCASTNEYLLFEIGLLVDPLDQLRVSNIVKMYNIGHWFIYDPSFEHQLKLNSQNKFNRIFLTISMLHPDAKLG